MSSAPRKFQLVGSLTYLDIPASSVFLRIGEDPAYSGGPIFVWFLVDSNDFNRAQCNIRVVHDDETIHVPHKYLGSCAALGRMVHAFQVP